VLFFSIQQLLFLSLLLFLMVAFALAANFLAFSMFSLVGSFFAFSAAFFAFLICFSAFFSCL